MPASTYKARILSIESSYNDAVDLLEKLLRIQGNILNAGINLVAVAEAQILWKMRLRDHVLGNIPMRTRREDGIGQLSGLIDGAVLKQLCEPELLRQLKEEHRKFNQLDAFIVESLEAGDRDRAAEVLRNEYSQSLQQIIHTLAKINRCLRFE